MFDVRPVDETGDLDWKRINSIGAKESSEKSSHSEIDATELKQEKKHDVSSDYNGSGGVAYILGVPIKSEDAPIMHDPNFSLNDNELILDEWRKVRKNDQNYILEENKIAEKKQIEIEEEKEKNRLWQLQQQQMEQQKLLIENRLRAQEEFERQAVARAQRQEKLRLEESRRQEELKRIAEQHRVELETNEKLLRIEKEKKQRAERMRQQSLLEKEHAEKIKKQKTNAEKTGLVSEVSKKKKKPQDNLSWRNIFFPKRFIFQFDKRRSMAVFAGVAFFLVLGIGGVSYASKGLGMKGKLLGESQDGYASLTNAMSDMAHQNFEGSSQQFSQALANFSQASNNLQEMGGILLDTTRFIPFVSKISSGKNAIEAGKHLSAAGQALNNVVNTASQLKNPIDPSVQNNVSLLDVLNSSEKNIAIAKTELDSAQQNIDNISIDDLPQDKQGEFLTLKQKLPDIRSALNLFLNNSQILFDLLGGNGPRKYLFLFQNNSEMRATGGFIGSYGLLDIADGHVKKFFIDGIFNPDGQLKDRIVPPEPIQKISANWSMHDSNWFPDFPLSAQKAIYFYEKTGGPTADGVITLTPTVMQKLLAITGPIDMPDYGVTLDSDNFLELTQYEVEDNYDKTENQPKKILSDLAPLLLDKLFSSRDLDTISKTADALLSGLQEKQILFYSQNTDLQKIISQQGWSGEILPASKDYVSVINTNINGFKTDAVIDESISHQAQIQSDGSVVDTLTITRKHNGGNTPYDWLNKVNADYMRVYVPEGSKLLDVSGQTREVDSPPVDYDALGFKRDSDVQSEEANTTVDPSSGTRIYSESGKTVFANWTYVSPGETMTITYKYLLPFSLFKVSVGNDEQVDSYSLVAQKQSGSIGSSFSSDIMYPTDYGVKWNFPEEAQKSDGDIKSDSSLKTDQFEGIVFEKNN